ncbi:pectate lyase family protein [Aureliella helgolandensis]|uniref:pectate lyase family protein n=1 Tax=Aureliella helgolandensis TaxID=2527968 RepID=UPI0011A6B988|nr:pectate lyase [Aureliella helgolandensis]
MNSNTFSLVLHQALLSLGVVAAFGPVVWGQPPSTRALPAFPGAEGFGAESRGGRGGEVIEVTNLNDRGPGSFRAACEAANPRTVVFRTGGTITLKSTVQIREPYITIAGQTAPGGGILLKADPRFDGPVLNVGTHDATVRGLRIRRGPTAEKGCCGDGLSITSASTPPHDVIVDHCSISWSTDENVESWYAANDITIQWCIISEALDDSSHEKGPHSKGTIIGAEVRRVSYHHNLLAHNVARNPLISNNDGPNHVVNNLVYNWKYFGAEFSHVGEHPPRVNLIGNTYQPGPDTRQVRYEVSLKDYPMEPTFYARDNRGHHRQEDDEREWSLVGDGSSGLGADWMRVPANSQIQRAEPWPDSPIPITVQPSEQASQLVLAAAGAILPRRDTVDERIILDVRNRTGKCIDDPSEVGGWPLIDEGRPAADIDHDGMPDAWEVEHGLNSSDAADRNGLDLSSTAGYTNLEMYLNGLWE